MSRYTDSLIHFAVGAALAAIMLWFDTHSLVILWGLYLFGYAREQAQVGMRYRDYLRDPWLSFETGMPHPWKPWQWSTHSHVEALAWPCGGLAALALL